MSAILNDQIQPVSETGLSSLAMMSVLYKCDTTRMVGRLINSTAIYTSLLISLKTIPPGYLMKYYSSTIPL